MLATMRVCDARGERTHGEKVRVRSGPGHLRDARVGCAFNNWLPYIKGGYAGADLRTLDFDNLGSSLDHREWRSGYTVGGGLAYGFTPNWTVGVEYAFMDFGTATWRGNTIGPLPTQEFLSDNFKI